MRNALNWFEIPATNFERAKAFYEDVLQAKMHVMDMPAMDAKYAFFPAELETGGVGGGLTQGPGHVPSQTGTLVYLNAGDDLAGPLGRVQQAGGQILVPKTSLGPNGFMAQFLDTEGNRVALHSRA